MRRKNRNARREKGRFVCLFRAVRRGKRGTLKAKLFEEFADQITYSVSATTRGPREGEVNGKDYFFITRQEFERRVQNNEFLEHAEFAGNCYGTPRAYVEKLLNSGMNVVLEIDVQARFR